jgi:hypothetical protein
MNTNNSISIASSAMLVEPAGKLAVTWGNVKLIR